ncbi:MAG: hypothetical protein AAF456_21540 [Planctomycetota bacterium]
MTNSQFSQSNDRHLILLGSSPRWQAAIIRERASWRISWALDIADLFQEAETRHVAFGLIEVNRANLAGICKAIASRSIPGGLLLAAAGNFELTPWLPQLRSCGFSAVFQSLNQADQLVQMGERHFDNAATCSRRSLEEIIESRLPWKPVLPSAANYKN